MSLELIILIGVIALAVLLCFLLAIANYAGERFYEKYKEIDKIEAWTDLMPLGYINKLNQEHFEGKIQVVQISTLAGDAYSKGKLFLSTNTINKNSLASYTIISHELGHAKQDRDGKKLKRLAVARKLGRFIGHLLFPFLIVGAVLLFFENLFWIGVGALDGGGLIFLIALVLKLITISIEKDASRNAIIFLKEVFDGKQLKTCKKFLKDARLTYWADFLRALFFWTAMSKKTKLFN